MSGSAQELHQFSGPELVFGALRECTRSRNQGIIIRKLMRVFFLHNSTYKQQLFNAVVLPARNLTHARPRTKTVHNGWFWLLLGRLSGLVNGVDTSQNHAQYSVALETKYFGNG